MLYLNVPYEQKNWAKKKGAKWNPERKQWYADERKKYVNLQKWILSDNSYACVVCDHFYIVEGKRICFKCGCMTQVIAFGIDKFLELYEPDEDGRHFNWHNENEGVYIVCEINNLNDTFKQYLRDYYSYYASYSRFADEIYASNHCQHCGAKQGEYYLFDEQDSPFLVATEEDARNLKLIEFTLHEDVIFDLEMLDVLIIGSDTSEHLIKRYAKKSKGLIDYN